VLSVKERESIIALNTIATIGGYRLANLLKRFGSAKSAINASERDLCQVRGIGKKTARRIMALRDGQTAIEETRKAKESGVDIVIQGDTLYPSALLNITYPPPVIYILGDILPSDAFSIAVVGSRKPGYYGTCTAWNLSKNAAEEGFTVVSGMARGIDSAAHRGAIAGGGRTIAVLGCGVDVVYPPENNELADRIKRNGAIISEFPFGTCPFPQNFPRRNRIISGLAMGVVIVQAGKSSGALITADFALEQGKEVFAVPGEIKNPLSCGTHSLIKQGAVLIEGISDILEELRIPITREHSIGNNPKQKDISPYEEKVLTVLGFSPMTTDDIVIATGLSAPTVTCTLVDLQLRAMISRVAGGYISLG
jgi:DNA processing protein